MSGEQYKCPGVPPSRARDSGTAAAGGTLAGTGAGTSSLKALANHVLRRNTERDSERNTCSNAPGQAACNCPAVPCPGERDTGTPAERVVCLFCGEPVTRGAPGTGAVADAERVHDLHIECWRNARP
jgi:hypothetical protein